MWFSTLSATNPYSCCGRKIVLGEYNCPSVAYGRTISFTDSQRVISTSTLEIWVKEGHPRSLKMTPFNRRNTTMVMFLISDSVIESPKIKSFPYRVWDLNFSNLLFTFTFFARSQNFWGQVVM